ncbi:MAG TPA: hypothetical protein PLD20_03745 [Blastocatellia bacterium]|nr:hypothetical protein [Blastocatellia bacterium]HMV86981.1 hypothetical protein [Blastocatellia bacterium]HMX27304.1 hypothetical protein [Blastocatellia bacterium]HMZ17017.1 hypothetical protein [Blastocatellia bacterium]HNG33019.1 hypothetical protein [Blastocatellia bacterium]
MKTENKQLMKTEAQAKELNESHNTQAEALADLQVADEQACATKGGTDQFALNFTKIRFD